MLGPFLTIACEDAMAYEGAYDFVSGGADFEVLCLGGKTGADILWFRCPDRLGAEGIVGECMSMLLKESLDVIEETICSQCLK